MVADRVRLLQTGREITLPIVPVDPRDFFRGEYVRLGYDIGRVPAPAARRAAARSPTRPSTSPWSANRIGTWVPVKLALTWSEGNLARSHRAEGARAMSGRLFPDRSNPNAAYFVRYGTESYSARQGEGLAPSRRSRAIRSSAARIAVDKSGNAAIKGLLVDGVLQYEEPLF